MNQAHRRLGDVLRDARERREIDLARAERETKIRVRYLDALERGEYQELPGSVYTKGFLRNYGRYLGLDPEELVEAYRREAGEIDAERRVVVAPPTAPRTPRAFVITPGALLAVFLTILVGGFAAYLVYQFVTFARTPGLVITDPPRDLASYEGTEYTIRGETEPNSRITVEGLRENPEARADAEGRFEVVVGLVPGANVITITASDPRTGRDSEPQERTIYVVPEAAETTDPPATTLTVDEPAEDATVTGPVGVRVATGADAVSVSATPVEPPEPRFTITDAAGRAVSIPDELPDAPDPLELTAGEGGFEGEYRLPPATWDLTITATIAGGEELNETRRITVEASTERLNVRVEVRGSESYLELYVDGRADPEHTGRNAPPRTNIDLAATRTIRVRAGSAGAVTLVIEGVRVGPMGELGQVVDWTVTRDG